MQCSALQLHMSYHGTAAQAPDFRPFRAAVLSRRRGGVTRIRGAVCSEDLVCVFLRAGVGYIHTHAGIRIYIYIYIHIHAHHLTTPTMRPPTPLTLTLALTPLLLVTTTTAAAAAAAAAATTNATADVNVNINVNTTANLNANANTNTTPQRFSVPVRDPTCSIDVYTETVRLVLGQYTTRRRVVYETDKAMLADEYDGVMYGFGLRWGDKGRGEFIYSYYFCGGWFFWCFARCGLAANRRFRTRHVYPDVAYGTDASSRMPRSCWRYECLLSWGCAAGRGLCG